MRRGFTLLEALVATVLMAVAVSGLLASLSTSLRNASNLTEYDRAALLARRKMDELLATHRLPKNAVIEGRWDPRFTGAVQGGWRARATLYELPPTPGPGQPALERIELEVWWQPAERRRSFTLEAHRTIQLTPEDLAGQ